MSRGIVIRKDADNIVMENPGSIRTGKRQMLKGGISDPRNKALMKMLNLIGIGERAGSGVPNIYGVWENQGWKAPEVEEQYNPDRTILRLSLVKDSVIKSKRRKQAIKTSDKKQAKKTNDNIEKIRIYLQKNGESKAKDIAEYLELSPARTRVIIAAMDDVKALGANSNRTYILTEEKAE